MIKLTSFGHSSYLDENNETKILFDPSISSNPKSSKNNSTTLEFGFWMTNNILRMYCDTIASKEVVLDTSKKAVSEAGKELILLNIGDSITL